MTERSLRASPEGIQKLRKAIKLNAWKQDELRDELGLKTRQPITRVLAGEPIERATFEELCHLLDLPVAEIVASDSEPTDQTIDIAALVQTIRSRIQSQIHQQCGTMRVLDMTQPIALTGEQGIYTSVNILEKVTGRRRLELPELLRHCDLEDFDRAGLSHIIEPRVPGLDAAQRYSKLMVLGKPGAGKTTFLKYLAMQCITGNFLPDHVPIFVTLKQFAETKGEPDLLTYCDWWVGAKHSDKDPLRIETSDPSASPLQTMVRLGKIFFLLDGLDEVREEDTRRVIQQIEQCATQFSANQFVITCRIAAKEYTFGSFTEVEVADFDDTQIQTFAGNWFRTKSDPDRANLFWQKLEENEPIKELATSPLLLTLLCLMFEDTTSFPANRAELYKEGLDVLLKKWDGKRKIERDVVYKNLSLKRKEDLLSQIALTTFADKAYFFKQRQLENYISEFIRNLPDAKTDPEALHLDSEAVLKSIESHHGLLIERAKGIYSFSHLTFHEYFAAREIVESRNPTVLQQLASHITEPRWREVFFLTAGMMRNADELMRAIKQQIDELLAADEKLQQFLTWVQEKGSVDAPYKSAAIRAAYFGNILCDDYNSAEVTLAINIDLKLDVDMDNRCTDELFGDDYVFDQTFKRVWNSPIINEDLRLNVEQLELFTWFIQDLLFIYRSAQDSYIHCKLQGMIEQLPEGQDSKSIVASTFLLWWQSNTNWRKELQSVIIEYRNIGYDWQFSSEQKELLTQYYDANKLLVDCLNSDCYVSRDVRAETEETLLLPWQPPKSPILGDFK